MKDDLLDDQQIDHSFRRVWSSMRPAKLHVVTTNRFVDSYRDAATGDHVPQTDLRSMCFEDLFARSLGPELDSGIARIFYNGTQGVIFGRLPTALYGPYDVMFNYFPHRGYPIAHRLDEIPLNERTMLFALVQEAQEVIRKRAATDGRALSLLEIEKHFGAAEADHYLPYRHAYLHSHIHVYGVPEVPLESDGFNIGSPSRLARHTYRDPTIFIARDLLLASVSGGDRWSNMVLNPNTSSLETEVPGRINLADEKFLQFVTSIEESWPGLWHEVADCFTDFSHIDYEYDDRSSTKKTPRLKVRTYQDRMDRVRNFIKQHAELSSESHIVLLWIARHLRDANQAKMESHFFNGIAGSWGIQELSGTSKFIFSPRALVIDQRAGATGGYLVNTDRSKWLPEEVRHKLMEVQIDLMKAMGAKDD